MPRPRMYGLTLSPSAKVASRPSHCLPGSAAASAKDDAPLDGWSGPASGSSTVRSGSSLGRAARTAPAEPAPTTTTSFTLVDLRHDRGRRKAGEVGRIAVAAHHPLVRLHEAELR